MATIVKKISTEDLKKMIVAEAKNLKESLEQMKKKPEDVKADEKGWEKATLEKKIEFLKALKLEEKELVVKLKKIQEKKQKITESITRDV